MDLSVPDRIRIRHGIFFHLQLGHHLRAVEIDIFTHHTGLNIWQRKKKGLFNNFLGNKIIPVYTDIVTRR
jgi:hypothetical protein